VRGVDASTRRIAVPAPSTTSAPAVAASKPATRTTQQTAPPFSKKAFTA
jgi:hypothetical protein